MLSVVGQKDRSRKTPSHSMVTFATRADFQESGSQALSGADAETRVFWVFLLAGQDGARWREAVRWDSFHLHFFLKIHVDGPVEDIQNQFIQHKLIIYSDTHTFIMHPRKDARSLFRITTTFTFKV